MAEHIHWKKTTNPNYLGTFAFEEGQELVVKIADVRVEMVNDPKGGGEEKPIAYFDGDVKPNKMILNKTNMERIEKATGTPYMDEWVGHKIQLYVDPAVPAFGTVGPAVRIRDFEPK